MRRLIVAALAAAAMTTGANAAEVFDYQLNGSLADANGGASITNNGGALTGTGIDFGANQGPSIGGFSNTGVYSIETKFSFTDVGGYNKVLDFKSLSSDGGFYVLDGALRFYPTASGSAFAANTLNHLVVTRDASNLFSAYLNGALALSFNDAGGAAVITDTLYFFRDDNWTGGGEASPGTVDFIRTYNTALSSNDVASLYRGGDLPGGAGAVPEPATWAFMILGFGGVGSLLRRRRQASALA